MASYQAIETKLRQLEDKIDFVMKSFTLTRRVESAILGGPSRVETVTLARLYRDLNSLGAELIDELTAEAPGVPQDALPAQSNGPVASTSASSL